MIKSYHNAWHSDFRWAVINQNNVTLTANGAYLDRTVIPHIQIKKKRVSDFTSTGCLRGYAVGARPNWDTQTQTLDTHSQTHTLKQLSKNPLWVFEDLSPPVKLFSWVSDTEHEVRILYPQVGSLKYSCRELPALDKIRYSLYATPYTLSTPNQSPENPTIHISFRMSVSFPFLSEKEQHNFSLFLNPLLFMAQREVDHSLFTQLKDSWFWAPSRPVGHSSLSEAHVENPTSICSNNFICQLE